VFIKLIYLLINHKILSYNYLLLRDDFRIGLVISPMVANTATRGILTGQYGNHHVMIYLLINHKILSYNGYLYKIDT
jgi:hypothetical protein